MTAVAPRGLRSVSPRLVDVPAMWCKQCRQDVPGIATAGGFTCARCVGELGSEKSGPLVDVADLGIDLSRVAESPVNSIDQWESDEALCDMERILRSHAPEPGGAVAEAPPHFEPALPALERWDAPAPDLRPESREPAPAAQGPVAAWAWLTMAVGLMGFACGGVLLGWSLLTDRPELWSLGMPIALVGQCGLVIGLVLQLERIWQTNRDNTHKLESVDERLHDLRRSTGMPATMPTGRAPGFYGHLAEGASPQLLLADVKGQLDLLTLRMGRESR